ncbi:MAG: helix-turn-helix transcriptional regulator [Phycisphaerae bacterium]|nr:helix-turn-helix transcriptional regulator [Phycisphaerae bacterium]
MAVTLKRDLLGSHAALHFRLVHAAIGSYPVQAKGTMTVNRMLMIFEDAHDENSCLRDGTSGKRYILQPGTIYFIPCRHEVDMKLTEGLRFVSFQFTLDFYHGFDVFRNYGKCVPIHNPELISEAKSLFDKEADAWMLCRVNEILFRLCSFLLMNRRDIGNLNRPAANRHLPLLEYVQEHGDATTTVADLASMSRMRQDVFSRTFTREMKITPKEFMDNTLTRKAIQLLLGTSLSIKEVSHQLRFSSEGYFSRFFKRHTGTVPRDFRNTYGKR